MPALAAALMATPQVRFYHDHVLVKEGGTRQRTPWHQDQHYFPLDTDNTITMWMPLVDLTPEMGIMRFASGSHREGYLGDMPISDDSEAGALYDLFGKPSSDKADQQNDEESFTRDMHTRLLDCLV